MIFNIIILILILPFLPILVLYLLPILVIFEIFSNIISIQTSGNLANYTRKNKINGILKSTKVEWRLVKISPINYIITCKEHPLDTNKKGRLLTISSKHKFNVHTISAIWSAIQMDFKKLNKFRDYNQTYFQRNVIINYKKIIFESKREKFYPNIPNEAQNEFCRLIYNPKENAICCIQIWEEKPEKFFITGDKKVLQGLIKEAPNYLLPFKNFSELLNDFQAMSEVEIQYTPLHQSEEKNNSKENLSCIKQKKEKKPKKQTKKEQMRKQRQELEKIKIEEAKKIKKIDINNADLEPIRKLPGINVVIAKRIINKREEINGFSTVQEVLDFINLNPHMSKTLEEQICVKPIKINPATIKHNEVNIDL